jgi:hypothetical protein
MASTPETPLQHYKGYLICGGACLFPVSLARRLATERDYLSRF